MKTYLPNGLNNPVEVQQHLKTKPESYWIKRGETRALYLFHQMAKRVPAYKDFLKKNKVYPDKMKTVKDFNSVPTIDKNNYLRSYPRKMLCWDGEFKDESWVISTTSGSTGHPFYFPRQDDQDLQYALAAELFLRSNFDIDKKSTLFIVGFPMGAWIGGLFTYQALKHLVKRGNYKLSIITPGINKLEILKAVKNLGRDFDQVIIGSYGPFLKDTLDDGLNHGLDWKKYNLGFIFAAEGFNETFRDYVIKKAGLKNPYKDTLNIYGTVDLGTMSHETPLSVLIRRMAVEDQKIYQMVFSQISKLPTLTQFIPELFYFEDINGNLICSSFSGIPLVRYDLKDHGGVFTLEEIIKKFSNYGIDLYKKARGAQIAQTIWNLPFVHVYERSDFSVSFFAFQIYPETIRKALQEKTLETKVTGKFTMMVKYNKQSNQFLEINVELKAGVRESDVLKNTVRELIVKRLLKENSEYRKTSEEYPDRTIPKIVLWSYEDPTYFKSGTKQKWVKK